MGSNGRTLHRKLVDEHTVSVLSVDEVLLFVDLHVMNEYTSPQAFAGLADRDLRVPLPGQHVAVVDHVISTEPSEDRIIRDPAAALQVRTLRRNCEQHGIALFDTTDRLQGIEHVVTPELGMIMPGMVVLCGDSHATTYGAFGAFGFGIGTSEVEQVLATQTVAYRVARDMRIRVEGSLAAGCTSKDLILHIINVIGARGARGHVVEFVGAAIDHLSMEARMTLCNMAVEAGARGAVIAPDEQTVQFVMRRATLLGDHEDALERWADLHSDPEACFDVELTFDAREVAPYVTWGTSPDQSVPIGAPVPNPAQSVTPGERAAFERAQAYMGIEPDTSLEGLNVDRVFIGSCTNGRIEDLRAAAEVAKGRRVHPGVRAMVVPGSGLVRLQAEAEGIAGTLIDAGFEWRKPGCSMCLAMNDDILGPGERCASTTNRNFEGRQGRQGRTHLMSPAMAAAAAIAGHITDVRRMVSVDVDDR